MPEALARLVDDDADPRVRAAALGALARLLDPPTAAWTRATTDADPTVRRRAADLAPAFVVGQRPPCPSAGPHPAATTPIASGLLVLLADPDVAVAEAAAWALGEFGVAAVAAGAVARLSQLAGSHGDALVREAAVAALGALGDTRGLPAILRATTDKPAVRRRAVVALAPFEGPDVEAALRRACADRDRQVRQAAEDLLAPP